MNTMLTYNPIPWLMAQEGLPAVRARRSLDLCREGDQAAVNSMARKLTKTQLPDGSFEQSPMRTAGVLNRLSDLKPAGVEPLFDAGVAYLFSVLESQPGYKRVNTIQPGGLRVPCDLGGFFGPYEDRNRPEVLAWGARESNHLREFEPLLGPQEIVRSVRKSSFDRVGPESCFSWGLVPLCCAIEAICRAGYANDPRLMPAVKVLLGAQRESGGWCRNLAGHPNCTLHAIRALGAHPELRNSAAAHAALRFMRATQCAPSLLAATWWRGKNLFAAVQAMAMFDLPVAREILSSALKELVLCQRKNGTFGAPNAVERVAAVLAGCRVISQQTVK